MRWWGKYLIQRYVALPVTQLEKGQWNYSGSQVAISAHLAVDEVVGKCLLFGEDRRPFPRLPSVLKMYGSTDRIRSAGQARITLIILM